MDESLDFEPPMDGRDLSQLRRRLGITLRAYLNIDPSYHEKVGPIIVAVEPGGLADSLGIKPGDMILEIDGMPINELAGGKTDLASAAINYWTTNDSTSIVLTVKRSDEKEFVRVVIPAD
jgi:C-terminal processing protease CtpA/Prc